MLQKSNVPLAKPQSSITGKQETVAIQVLGKRSQWVPDFGASPTAFACDLFFTLDTEKIQGICYPGPISIESNSTLIDLCKEARSLVTGNSRLDGILTLEGETRSSFRYRILDHTVAGRMVSLRRMPKFVPTVEELGCHESVKTLAMHKYLTQGGLVIVSGETGQGKSTIVASIIKSRMIHFGTFGLTVEDPPEMPLHGKHGSGYCIQTDARGDFSGALKGALRSYPAQSGSILLVGEARDSESAAEALRASANGHLVFLTMHGLDPIWTLKRFVLLASASKSISEVEALNLLSSSFRLCIHQKIRILSGGRSVETVVLASKGASSPVANRMRDGRFETLSTILAQQQQECLRGEATQLFEV